MGKNLTPLIPFAAVVMALAFLLEPHFVGGARFQQIDPGASPMEGKLFVNKPSEPGTRNPFVTHEHMMAMALDEAHEEARFGPTDAGGTAGPNADEETEAVVALNETTEASAERLAWRLSATLVHERRQAAVINGRIYEVGEKIPPATAEGRRARLAQVDRDLIVLEVEGRSRPILLGYNAGHGKGARRDEAIAAKSGRANEGPIAMPGIMGMAQAVLGGQGVEFEALIKGLAEAGLRP